MAGGATSTSSSTGAGNAVLTTMIFAGPGSGDSQSVIGGPPLHAMKPATIDEYIAAFPADVGTILARIRATVRDAAPAAEETISYQMPAFRQNGILIYFAAFRNHIGVYPPVTGDAGLEKAVAKYAGEKGNLRFPLDQPIPYALIARIVKLRLKENAAKVAPGKRKATSSKRAAAGR
jgi:uncharacterized protein YdhG (YjbR/CyaY superfamily)